MKGIKGSAGYDRFEGYANAHSQNYDDATLESDKTNIVLSRPDGNKKMFTVSNKVASALNAQTN